MLFHFMHFQQASSFLSCSFLTVTKTLIFASVMEDKLENNKNYMECFLIFSEVNVYFLKEKKKRRLDLLHKYPVYNARKSYLPFLTVTRYSC